MDDVKFNAYYSTCDVTIGSCRVRYDAYNKSEIICPCVHISVDKEIKIENMNSCKKYATDKYLVFNDTDKTNIVISHNPEGNPEELHILAGKNLNENNVKEDINSNREVNKYSCVRDKLRSVHYSHYYSYAEYWQGFAREKHHNNRLVLSQFLKESLEKEEEERKKGEFENFLRNKYKI